jgi:hypothetical protein
MPLGNVEGRHRAAHSVVAPESALGSLASVALSSAQAIVILGGVAVTGSTMLSASSVSVAQLDKIGNNERKHQRTTERGLC